jgi:FkbM family methyltransferase
VACFVDRGRADTKVDGIRVVHPDTIAAGDGRGAVLLLGVFNPVHSWRDPIAWGRSHGFGDVLTPVDLVDLFSELATYWMAPRLELRESLPALIGLAGMLADQDSVGVLQGLLSFRLTGDPAMLPPSAPEEQYLPVDFRDGDLAFPKPITFVDGGAFTGDTGRFLRDQNVEIAEWIAFEPDLGNFARLADTGRSFPRTRCSFFPLGLSDRNQDVSFEAEDSAASHIGAGGTSAVRCVAIDSILNGVRPDYVKLDIEGSEAAALAGMARTLEAARPKLAISAYHKPADLIDLAVIVRGLMPDARLYLRAHADSCFDTVLYAFPDA